MECFFRSTRLWLSWFGWFNSSKRREGGFRQHTKLKSINCQDYGKWCFLSNCLELRKLLFLSSLAFALLEHIREGLWFSHTNFIHTHHVLILKKVDTWSWRYGHWIRSVYQKVWKNNFPIRNELDIGFICRETLRTQL